MIDTITFNFSISFVGIILYYHWEAMVVSYLSTRIISLPFKGIQDLVTDSDYKLLTQPGSANSDAFKYSKDPFWQRAWKERMESVIKDFEGIEGNILNVRIINLITCIGRLFCNNLYLG